MTQSKAFARYFAHICTAGCSAHTRPLHHVFAKLPGHTWRYIDGYSETGALATEAALRSSGMVTFSLTFPGVIGQRAIAREITLVLQSRNHGE